MERCNKIRKMTAGIFSVLLAFNSVFAGGRMVFAGDFEEEKTAETVIKELEEKFKQVGVEIIYFPYTRGTSSTELRDKLDQRG